MMRELELEEIGIVEDDDEGYSPETPPLNFGLQWSKKKDEEEGMEEEEKEDGERESESENRGEQQNYFFGCFDVEITDKEEGNSEEVEGNEGEDRQQQFIENGEICLPSNRTTRPQNFPLIGQQIIDYDLCLHSNLTTSPKSFPLIHPELSKLSKLPEKERERLQKIYRDNLPSQVIIPDKESLSQFSRCLPFREGILFEHLQVVLFHINRRYEEMLPSGSVGSSLSIPLTSRCAERAFSAWDRHYRLCVFTSSAFVERSLFISQFSYSTILGALKATQHTEANVTFVYNLECRPKRKRIETDCWEKRQQLSVVENQKYLLKVACGSLQKKYPSLRSMKIPSKQFFFEALCLMAPGVTFSDHFKKGTPLDNIKATTLLYAHSIKEVTLVPYHLKVLREEKYCPKPTSPLRFFVDQQPNAIERFKKHYPLMLTYQKGCGEGNGREFVGGEKRMRDKKKWEDAVIVDWSETKGYELMSKDQLNKSVPRTSFPAGSEDKLVEFWELHMEQEVEVAEGKLGSEIEQQIEEEEREEKIVGLERNGGKIVDCVEVERNVQQSRRSRRIVRKEIKLS